MSITAAQTKSANRRIADIRRRIVHMNSAGMKVAVFLYNSSSKVIPAKLFLAEI